MRPFLIFENGDFMVDLETKIEYDFETDALSKKAVPVIVAAAGNSSRMQGISKIFESVCGVPVIIHTLRAFENSSLISRIILVSKSEDILRLQLLVDEYGISKVSDIVAGGANRQESVKNGLFAVGNSDENVLIHDGARPMVSDRIIENVVTALEENKCVVCGVKVKDTIKEIGKDGFVDKTLKRDNLISVQTPQGVRIKDYKEALLNANTEMFTDDASIMESIGIKTFVTEGDYKNVKITTKEDLFVAEVYLREGSETK